MGATQHASVCVCVCVCVGGYGGCEEKVTEHETVALLRTGTLAGVVVIVAGGLMSFLADNNRGVCYSVKCNELTTTVNE